MNGREEILLKAGSVAAAAIEIGEVSASEALATLAARTPEELRGSWPMVIAWGRLQHSYEIAESFGDYDGMAKLAMLQQKMVREMY